MSANDTMRPFATAARILLTLISLSPCTIVSWALSAVIHIHLLRASYDKRVDRTSCRTWPATCTSGALTSWPPL
jgi:hypothetical protein